MTIRRATTGDAAAVTALTRAAYARWVDVIGREPLPMVADHEAAIRDHRVDLLEREGDLVALVETILRAEDLLIENVAVAPRFQKQGHGRRMIDHAEQLARTAGLPCVRLYTNARFAANLALYASLGYRVEREEQWTGGVVVHMVKPLG